MNLGIIGLGLMGGSLGLALSKKTNHTVFGFDKSKKVLQKALEIGAIHKPLEESDYKSLDAVVFCLNPNLVVSETEGVAKKLKDGAVIIDIAGNKTDVVNAMKSLSGKYPALQFIGAHPMAGKEVFGIENACACLYENASCILVPVKASENVLNLLKSVLKNIGFNLIIKTNADNHDKMIAYTSQLPHLISSCYVFNPKADLHLGYSANSFKDLTRVAKMNADMWADLFFENADNLLAELNAFLDRADKFKTALEKKNKEGLYAMLQEGNLKKEIIDKKD